MQSGCHSVQQEQCEQEYGSQQSNMSAQTRNHCSPAGPVLLDQNEQINGTLEYTSRVITRTVLEHWFMGINRNALQICDEKEEVLTSVKDVVGVSFGAAESQT